MWQWHIVVSLKQLVLNKYGIMKSNTKRVVFLNIVAMCSKMKARLNHEEIYGVVGWWYKPKVWSIFLNIDYLVLKALIREVVHNALGRC